jgi:hypothetical protein
VRARLPITRGPQPLIQSLKPQPTQEGTDMETKAASLLAASECLDAAEEAYIRGNREKARAYLDLADMHLGKKMREEILAERKSRP